MRFDESAVFSAILDAERGGRFQVCPAEPFTARRRYVDETNVLETTFATARGELRLVDFMPLGISEGQEDGLQPPHAIMRLVEYTAGAVEVKLTYEPRFSYGEIPPHRAESIRSALHAAGRRARLRSKLPASQSSPFRKGLAATKRCSSSGAFLRSWSIRHVAVPNPLHRLHIPILRMARVNEAQRLSDSTRKLLGIDVWLQELTLVYDGQSFQATGRMLPDEALENLHSLVFNRLEVAPVDDDAKTTLEAVEDCCALVLGPPCLGLRYMTR